jgi:nitrate reductase alpha subunit
MHPFIHPLTGALDPVWEARSDWEIYKAIAKKFSEVAPEVLGVEQDVVLTPILHDTPAEIAQATRREGLEARGMPAGARPPTSTSASVSTGASPAGRCRSSTCTAG